MKRIIALLFVLFLAGPAFAQAPPPAPEPVPVVVEADPPPAPEPPPTLSERVSDAHASLMEAVTVFETGLGAQERADARVMVAEEALAAAEEGRSQVMQSRNAIRQALIDHLQSIAEAAEALIAELSF